MFNLTNEIIDATSLNPVSQRMTSKAKPTNMRGFANFTFAVCVKSGGEPFGACTSDEQCPLYGTCNTAKSLRESD